MMVRLVYKPTNQDGMRRLLARSIGGMVPIDLDVGGMLERLHDDTALPGKEHWPPVPDGPQTLTITLVADPRIARD